jgi:cation transport regulator ChaC
MKKVVRLTETELTSLIKKLVIESKKTTNRRRINEMENFVNPEAMETADAIYTIIGTVIGLLGISGYDYLKSLAQELMNQGKEKKAQKILDFVEANEPKGKEGMMDSEIDTEDEDDNFKSMAESIRRKTRKFPRR